MFMMCVYKNFPLNSLNVCHFYNAINIRNGLLHFFHTRRTHWKEKEHINSLKISKVLKLFLKAF